MYDLLVKFGAICVLCPNLAIYSVRGSFLELHYFNPRQYFESVNGYTMPRPERCYTNSVSSWRIERYFFVWRRLLFWIYVWVRACGVGHLCLYLFFVGSVCFAIVLTAKCCKLTTVLRNSGTLRAASKGLPAVSQPKRETPADTPRWKFGSGLACFSYCRFRFFDRCQLGESCG
jgi:hypothetical protein